MTTTMKERLDEALGRRGLERLTDLRVDRVAFVGKGDNPGAQVLFTKARSTTPVPAAGTPRSVVFAAMDQEARAAFPNLANQAQRIAAFALTDRGRQLYQVYRSAPADPADRGPAATTLKAASPAKAIADALEHVIRKVQRDRGVDYVTAYDTVVKSEGGRAALRAYEAARANG